MTRTKWYESNQSTKSSSEPQRKHSKQAQPLKFWMGKDIEQAIYFIWPNMAKTLSLARVKTEYWQVLYTQTHTCGQGVYSFTVL